MSELKVILEPHKGKEYNATLRQEVTVDLNQKRILVQTSEREKEGIKKPFLFGYVGNNEGDPINPVIALPKAVEDQITKAVKDQVGERKTSPPPVDATKSPKK